MYTCMSLSEWPCARVEHVGGAPRVLVEARLDIHIYIYLYIYTHYICYCVYIYIYTYI